MHKLINIGIIIIMGLLGYGATLYLYKSAPSDTAPPLESADQRPNVISLSNLPLPDFDFTDMTGNKHHSQDFKGRVTILNLWATWCPPCIKELPVLLEIAKQYPDDVTLIALSADFSDEAITNYLARANIQDLPDNIIIARDAGSEVISGVFRTYQLPETYIMNPAHEMIYKFIGADWESEQLKQIIEQNKGS